MSGTKAGGLKAAVTNKAKYGDEFYANIGRKGGAEQSHWRFRHQPSARSRSRRQRRAKITPRAGNYYSMRGMLLHDKNLEGALRKMWSCESRAQ